MYLGEGGSGTPLPLCQKNEYNKKMSNSKFVISLHRMYMYGYVINPVLLLISLYKIIVMAKRVIKEANASILAYFQKVQPSAPQVTSVSTLDQLDQSLN